MEAEPRHWEGRGTHSQGKAQREANPAEERALQRELSQGQVLLQPALPLGQTLPTLTSALPLHLASPLQAGRLPSVGVGTEAP